MKDRPKGFLEKLYNMQGYGVALDGDEKREIGSYISELHGLLWRVVRILNPGASGCLTDYIEGSMNMLEAVCSGKEVRQAVHFKETGYPAPPKRWITTDGTGCARYRLEDIETGIGYKLSDRNDVEVIANKLNHYAVGEVAPLNDEEQAIYDRFVDVADIFPKPADPQPRYTCIGSLDGELIYVVEDEEPTEDVDGGQG